MRTVILVFALLLVSCGTHRTVQQQEENLSVHHLEQHADTFHTQQHLQSSSTITTIESQSTVTVERDTMLYTWDTVGSTPVVTSAVRIHMLAQMKDAQEDISHIDDLFADIIADHHVTVSITDSLHAIYEQSKEGQIQRPPAISKGRQIVLTLLAILLLLLLSLLYAAITDKL